MNPQTTQKKLERKIDKIRYKYVEKTLDLLDEYFPKGKSKGRGEAMCILAFAFAQGMEAQKEISKLK